VTLTSLVSDAPGFIDFLMSAFGAVEIDRTVGQQGRIANAQMRIGTTPIHGRRSVG
jgi:PhnB protein